jgi:DNA-directed RNA polymerase sigma subunit (sigma70/sigma32)
MTKAELARRHRALVRRNRLIVKELANGTATMPELACRYQITREYVRQIARRGACSQTDTPTAGTLPESLRL